jgi:hypothetical protein
MYVNTIEISFLAHLAVVIIGRLPMIILTVVIYKSYFKSLETVGFESGDYIFHTFKLTISLIISFACALFVVLFFVEGGRSSGILIPLIGYFSAVAFVLLAAYFRKNYEILRLVWFGNNAAILVFLLYYVIRVVFSA